MKKWWVKLLLVLGVVVLALAMLITTSSVHSKNAVDRYKDQLRAAGEKLGFNDFVPAHVDSDKNGLEFFQQAVPAMPAAGILSTNPPMAMKMVAPGKAMVGWQQAEIISEDNSRCTNSWADLAREVQMEQPALDLLRQTAERPQLNFELDYNQGFNLLMPHLAKLKQAALFLSASTMSDLHHGDSASAATNLQTILLILDRWKTEPLLISQLVRMALTQIAMNGQWEFLQSTNATEPQLAMLQHDWSNLQLIGPMENSLLMERVWAMHTIEVLRTSNSPSSIMGGPGPSYAGGGSGDWLDTFKDMGEGMKHRASDNLWRVSWSYDDELAIMQGNQALIETVRQVETNGFFQKALDDRDRKLAALGFGRPGKNWLRNHMDDQLEMLGAQSVESVGHSLDRLLVAESARTMTFTAIALKRYQLRHGSYPGTLNALVPELLSEVPRDPVDGHPLRYQVLPDGSFLLYSIGGDNIDNGGDASAGPGLKAILWQRGRDWVWPRPATPQEIDFFRTNQPKIGP